MTHPARRPAAPPPHHVVAAQWRVMPACGICGSKIKAAFGFGFGEHRRWFCWEHVPVEAGDVLNFASSNEGAKINMAGAE